MIDPFPKPIYVTRPFLPPLEVFCDGLKEIWDNKWLTNNGPIENRFAKELSGYFKTNNICLFANGTLALQIGLQGLGITGEVITTPFTFVATIHALYWNKIRPVFVDIEPDFYTLDPAKIEASITPWTTAILGVHVFGHPCKVELLEKIARKYNLKVIYDAAHAFGVQIDNKPLALFGDLSMFSFHATKLYHTVEGGMLVFQDSALKTVFNYLKNFGFENEVEVVMPGTNAKMNELQALMGSIILKYIDQIIERREKITKIYRSRLEAIPGIILRPEFPAEITYNYSYFPIEIDEKEFGADRDFVYEELKKYNVFARRYFFPLVCDFPCYKHVVVKDPLTVARRVAKRILTLPIYFDLRPEDVEKICDIIAEIRG